MLSRFSMMQKLLITLIPATALILLGMLIFIQVVLRGAVTEDAVESVRLMARFDGREIENRFDDELRALAALAEAGKAREAIAPEERRDYFNRLLSIYLKGRPELLGVWTVWEPDAFDGEDARHAGTDGHDATGRFIPYWYRDAQTIQMEPLKGYETPGDGDYYLLARDSGKPVVLDPFAYEVGGQQVAMTSIVVPIEESGRVAGVVGADISLAAIKEFVGSKRHFGGITALFGHDGEVISHPDAARIGKNVAGAEQDTLGEDLARFVEALEQGKPFTAIRDSDLFDGDGLLLTEPLTLAGRQGQWSIGMTLPFRNVLAETNALLMKLLLIGVFGVALMVGVIWILGQTLTRPLRRVVGALSDIASGEGDLTQRLPVEGRDEIALLSSNFNDFVAKIHDLVAQVMGATTQLAAASEQLSMTSEGTREHVQRQQGETDQVATAMNEMTATVQEIAAHANNAAQAAREADQEARNGGEVVRETIDAIGALARQVEGAAEVIHRLEADSDEIGKVLDVIRGVAEQTNLLALNAAIEAARAGEQGRGFAVVAAEVRSLASRTQDSTKEIQTMIERLQGGANEAVTAMQQGQARSNETVDRAARAEQSLASIGESITRINDMNTQIASAAEEQSAVAEEIDRNLVSIVQSVDGTLQSSGQIASSSEGLARLAADLQERVGRFKV
ncbi:methyl-accepting chemotaxis protein [Imhoffiella purpurea]|uniref:Methyl-accepting chemotaxis protein n=1 Tax=Imhoffiella purpurea TaxID=1249627 RepID=W9V907_9GAMM|nr:methyl-accepting chemotaxis protein [Imhoffiella purpurea]EXJ15909.1 Methyl-accepting chemotaxis protein [Imhoffiella purpurea]